MPTSQQPDLIARIATECSLTRSEARKVLRDLIDYHKRSAASTGHIKLLRFKPPPVNTVITRNNHMLRTFKLPPVSDYPNPQSSSEHLFSEFTRSRVFEPSNSGRKQDHSQRQFQPLLNLPDGTTINKTEFIVAHWHKGRTYMEITVLLCKLMEPKPGESQATFKRRVSKRVSTTISREKKRLRDLPQ